MNIALLHYSAPPVVGGVESVMAHQARCMAHAGQGVRIIAGRGQQSDPDIPFVELPLADSRHERVLGVKYDLDAGRATPAFEALRDELVEQLETALAGVEVVIVHNVCSLNKNLALTAALYQLFNRQSPAIPALVSGTGTGNGIGEKVSRDPRSNSRNVPDPSSPLRGSEVGDRGKKRDRGENRKLIIWHHDLAWTTPRYQDELHNGYPWDLLRIAWPGAAQVAISDMRRDELSGLMGISNDAISVIPNGLDIERFFKLDAATRRLTAQTHLLEADLILLLPVRITPRKNIELALHILAQSRAQFARPMLVVTGPLGPHNGNNAGYFDRLKALRSELQLDGAAHFLAELHDGFLPDEVIADFYRLSDALLLPSREEGFGLPMLEAGISRMPAFCADIPPLRALGEGDADFFSPDADPASVAALIAERMKHAATYRSAARVRSQFTWGQVYQLRIEPLLRSQFQSHNQ